MKRREKIFNVKFLLAFSTLAIVLLVILFLAYGYYLLHFVPSKTLTLFLSPTSVSINLTHGQMFEQEYEIDAIKKPFCEINCDEEVIDMSTNKILFHALFNLSQNKQVRKVLLRAPYTGTGQIIYNYKIHCRTKKNLLCIKNEEARALSIITLNYDLSKEEADLQAKLKYFLMDNIKKFDILDIKMAKAEYLSKFESYLNPEEKAELPLKEFEVTYNILNNAVSLWNSEAYVLLKDKMPIDFNNLSGKIDFFTEKTINDIMHYNNISSDLKKTFGIIQETYPVNGDASLIDNFTILYNSFFSEEPKDYEMLALYSHSLLAAARNEKETILRDELLYDISKLTNTDYVDYYDYFNTNLSRIFEACSLLNKTINQNAPVAINFSYSRDLAAIEEHNNNIKHINRIIDESNAYLIYFHADSDISECSNLVKKANSEQEYLFKEFYLLPAYESCTNLNLNLKKYVVDNNLSLSFPINREVIPFIQEIKLNDSAINYAFNYTPNYNYTLNYTEYVYQLLAKCPREKHELTLFMNKTFEPIMVNLSYAPEKRYNFRMLDHLPICCVFGKCRHCCNTKQCLEESFSYPVVFVHGHMSNKRYTPEYSMSIFDKMQEKLQEEGYINAGVLLPNSEKGLYGEWGKSGNPVAVKVTYYYDVYDDKGRLINLPENNVSIETYASRLNRLVDMVKHKTGKTKVNIITHSMGGLVAREYIRQYGNSSVNKLVMIGTPNHGIQGRVDKYCPIIGESIECSQMSINSSFLRKLNSEQTLVDIYVIAGTGCGDGDGIVELSSALLDYSKNYVVNGTCTDILKTEMRSDLLDIDKYPVVFDIIKDILTK